jgi:hypothetical protein
MVMLYTMHKSAVCGYSAAGYAANCASLPVTSRLPFDPSRPQTDMGRTTSVIHAASQMHHPSAGRMNPSRPQRSPSLCCVPADFRSFCLSFRSGLLLLILSFLFNFTVAVHLSTSGHGPGRLGTVLTLRIWGINIAGRFADVSWWND